MYVIGRTSDKVHEYNLASPFDISTTAYVQNFSVKAQENAANGIVFNPGGTQFFIIGRIGDDVTEYALTNPFDISTAAYVQEFSVSAEEPDPTGLAFNSTGTKLYVIGTNTDKIQEYLLSSAYDIGTASFSQNFDVKPKEGNPSGLFFSADNTQLFVIGKSGDDVNEYSIEPDVTDPDEDGDSVPASVDCNDNDANVTIEGASCDDGDVATENDSVTADCTCSGTLIDPDADGDGVPASQDCNDNDANLTKEGANCNDGNAATENDIVMADCTCSGTNSDPDADGDNVPASEDCNDNDANLTTEGATCDDGDATTENDIVTNACTCAGTPIGGGTGLTLWTDNADYLSYDKKILIGTTTKLPSGFGLYVQDGILAEKVKVALENTDDWADYVFKETYQLKPVSEVEAFVKEHHHLPNVPAASDLHKNGIDLAKMDATLLQQIEELWLHVIEIKKESKELKKENEKLKKKVEELEKQ